MSICNKPNCGRSAPFGKGQPIKTKTSLPLVIALTITLTLVVACTYGFGRYIFRVLLVEMRQDMGFSYATAGLLNAAITMGYLALTAVIPSLTPRLGAVRIVLVANLICGLGLLAMTSANSAWTVGLLLALFGAASSGSWVPMVEVVRRFAPAEHQVKILGLIASGVNYGVFVNGRLAPVLVPTQGWRPVWTIAGWITLAITILAVVVMGVGRLLPRRDPSQRTPSSRRQGSWGRWVQRVRGVERPFLLLILMHGIAGFYGPTFGAFLSAYIQDEMGLSVAVNGQVWSIIGVGGMLSGFLMGWLGDRIGPRRTMQIVYVLGAVATVLVLHHRSINELYLAGLLNAFGFIPMYGLVAGYISRTASAEDGTFLFGLVNLAHGIAVTIGAYFGGLVQTWTGTFFWVYVVVLTAVLISLAISTTLPDDVVAHA